MPSRYTLFDPQQDATLPLLLLLLLMLLLLLLLLLRPCLASAIRQTRSSLLACLHACL